MKLSRIKTFERYSLNQNKNSLSAKKFNERLARWRKWANFIGNQFNRMNKHFCSPEMLLLKSPWVRNYLYYSSIHHSHRQHLALFFGLRQDLKNIHLNMLKQPVAIDGDKKWNKRENNRWTSDSNIFKFFPYPVYKEFSTNNSSKEKIGIVDRLKRPELNTNENFDPKKLTLANEIHYQKFILGKSLLILRNDKRKRVELKNFKFPTFFRQFNNENSDITSADWGNNLTKANDSFLFTNKSIPMVYRTTSLPNMNFDEAPLQAVDASKKISHIPSGPNSSATQQNVDLITEKVMEQIDRKLLIWRERTGKA